MLIVTKPAALRVRLLRRYRAYLEHTEARGFYVALTRGTRPRPARKLHVTKAAETALAKLGKMNVRVQLVGGKLTARVVTPPPAPPKPKSGKIVDVSNNNGHVDFVAVKKAGAVGVWLKVVEGTTFVDQTYLASRAAAKKAGLMVGGYTFLHPNQSAAAQVDFFLSHLKLEAGDLLPALDFEVADGQSNAALLSFIDAALARTKAKIGQQPVLYAGQYFVAGLPLHAPRWVPTYGAPPKIDGWAAWQFSDGQPQYPGAICKLDTSTVPDLAAVTYRGGKA